LTTHREDYYPIVIAIETLFPQSHLEGGKIKKSIQFTYGTFSLEDGKYKFKLLKQKLLVGKYFELIQNLDKQNNF